MKTKVYRAAKASFTMYGQKLPTPVDEVEKETIPEVLALALKRHALLRMSDHGVPIPDFWECLIETLDGHESDIYDRTYVVKWHNKLGAEMGIAGIFVDILGEPFLDHGPFLDFN